MTEKGPGPDKPLPSGVRAPPGTGERRTAAPAEASNKSDPALRRRAEAKAREKAGQMPIGTEALSPKEARRLVHDLRVHQIELEAQNEELRQTQQELESSRARYFDLYDLAPVGYFTLSEKGLILEANLAAAKLLGVERRPLLNQPLTRFILPDDQDIFYRHHRQFSETDAPQTCEMRMLRRSADPFWARVEAAAGQFAGGPPLCRLVMSDITERKQAEDKLRESEARHRALIASAAEGMVVADVETKHLLHANPAACRMFQYTEEQMMQLSVADIHPKESFDRVQAEFGAQARGEKTLAALPCLRKDGAVFDADVSAAPVGLNGRECIVGFFTDVTERNHSQRKIEHLNRLLRAIRNVNQLITREKDPEKLILESSRLLVGQWGYGFAMIILVDAAGNPSRHAQTGCGQAFEPMAESLRQGILPPCCAEARSKEGILHINDRARVCGPCSMAAQCAQSPTLCIPLRHECALHGCIVVAVDPALKIDAEEQSLFTEMAGDLAFALHGIEQEAAIRKSEDKRKALEAQIRQSQKMDVVGRLAGGVAHDFNNILCAILGNCGFLLNGIPKDDPRRADVEEIRQAGLRAADLTRQLLAFSRKQVMQLRVIDLNAVLTDTQKLLHRLIGEDIVLAVSLADKPALVKSDPGQMEQAVMNLAVNARDAMPKGGRLSIETRGIAVPASRPLAQDEPMPPGRYALLSVSDTGTGMDPGAMEHLFEPFFTTKELGKGTGLGLATVYGIVKQSNGFIDVESEPGRGTTFKIYLPEHQGARLEEEGEGDKRRRAAKGRFTILLVEDDDVVRRIACRTLKGAGYQVLEAGSAREARAHAEQDFDLLLTDIVLTDMSGVELGAALKISRPGIAVLYMTGYADNPDIRDILSRPENRLLQKPFTAGALLGKVQEALA